MTAFNNGPLSNKAGENNGSCKVFSFAKLHQLSDSATLKCFGEHYQKVLDTPDDDDHMNIRQFMKTGLEGISFEKEALSIKL